MQIVENILNVGIIVTSLVLIVLISKDIKKRKG